MPPEKFVTKIMVKESKQVHSGTTKSGGTYTMWQLIATKPDGTPITQNLRAFSDFPKNEVIEVECELYRSQQYGDSYTVKRKGGSNSGKLAKDIVDLTERVEAIEARLSAQAQAAPSPPPAPPPTAPPATPPPAPPASPPPAAAGLPRDDDIPF